MAGYIMTIGADFTLYEECTGIRKCGFFKAFRSICILSQVVYKNWYL